MPGYLATNKQYSFDTNDLKRYDDKKPANYYCLAPESFALVAKMIGIKYVPPTSSPVTAPTPASTMAPTVPIQPIAPVSSAPASATLSSPPTSTPRVGPQREPISLFGLMIFLLGIRHTFEPDARKTLKRLCYSMSKKKEQISRPSFFQSKIHEDFECGHQENLHVSNSICQAYEPAKRAR